ncbi:MAG: hypothetical protein NZO58_01010 [Gemmataceae bacterium]|nr:hypothetical protein [Gemmataceae bacterium]
MNQSTCHSPATRLFSWSAVVLSVGLCGFCSSASGCKSANRHKANDDPLFGVKPPQVSAVPSTSNSLGSPRASLPPLPQSTSATSNAALASLPGSRPLGIADAGAGWPAPKSTPPNVQPVPRDSPRTPPILTTGAWNPEPGAAVKTSGGQQSVPTGGDPALAPLLSRGAVNPKVEPDPEGVRLTVFVPNSASPGAMRIVTATARDLGAAVQAVLRQIDELK